MSIIQSVARLYFRHFPVERGKWRAWQRFSNNPVARSPRISAGRERIKYGFELGVDPDDFIGLFLHYWGCWEPNETWVVTTFLRPGDTFVDVGANIGYFALLASRIVGETGRVVAFEPVPTTADSLRRNLAANGVSNVEVHEAAVSDVEGTVTICQPHDSNVMANTMRPSAGARLSWEVPAAPLGQWLGEDHPPVKMIKVDVEGAELLVLRGIRDDLGRLGWPLVLCEITDPWLRELGGSADELLGLMGGLGYAAFRCENLRLSPYDPASEPNAENFNVLFARGGAPAPARP